MSQKNKTNSTKKPIDANSKLDKSQNAKWKKQYVYKILLHVVLTGIFYSVFLNADDRPKNWFYGTNIPLLKPEENNVEF